MATQKAPRQHDYYYPDVREQRVKGYFYVDGKQLKRNLFSFDELGLSDKGKAQNPTHAKRVNALCMQKHTEMLPQILAEKGAVPGMSIKIVFSRWIEAARQNIDIRESTIGIYEIMITQYLEVVGDHNLPVLESHIDKFKSGLSARMQNVTLNIRLRTCLTDTTKGKL